MNRKKLSKIYHYIRCVPKTVFFNLYYLPFKQAVRFPIIVNHRTKFDKLGGTITIPAKAKTGKIKLGFGQVQIADSKYSRFIWSLDKEAVVAFGNNIKVGTGCRLYITGKLSIGSGTNFTGEATIVCNKEISFGKENLISWQTLFMDSDLHQIIENKCQQQVNSDRPIKLSNRIWVCARSNILKGVSLQSNTIVSASSNVVHSFTEKNISIGGNPAKITGSMDGKSFKL